MTTVCGLPVVHITHCLDLYLFYYIICFVLHNEIEQAQTVSIVFLCLSGKALA